MESPQHAQAEREKQDDLTSVFETSAAMVRESFRGLEDNVSRPLIRDIVNSFQGSPVRSTFLAIFLGLSLIPILCFVGFAIFIYILFVSSALTVAVISATAVVTFSGVLLLGTLLVLFGVSFCLTLSLLLAYFLLRLAFLLYSSGARAGLSTWAHESRKQLLPHRLQPVKSCAKED